MRKRRKGSGPEFRKWCGIADEPKNTARFLRFMRHERRERIGALSEFFASLDAAYLAAADRPVSDVTLDEITAIIRADRGE